jgi:hypothetical protein
MLGLNKMAYLRRGLQQARANASTLFLVLIVTLQFAILFNGYLKDIFPRVEEDIKQPATYRSASILFGEEYAKYIEFVKAMVPEDGLVIIPKEEQVWNFGNVGLMQYFLFPRKIADCPVETLDVCILNLKGENSYILAPDSTYPPRHLAAQVKQFIPFDKDQGLYVPLP